MKLFLTTALFLSFAFALTAQNINTSEDYILKENISYRTSAEENQDEYIAERCKLDVYFPTKIKNFTTVVWFHGGGINSGNKSIPEKLNEKGIAVVAVN